ncbi:hypothetical protein [Streptomyces sp. NBC_01763]|uniref:hypothetical protein n=1 Tax=Streptomyces sp. NBC_01763 TaxID=2975934 RepID=UPI002DDC0767|nr:hypothetical protein [Streptomyces sp. NBC_01763]WSC40319.1 DUF262 domain-containing HNH endonuclease family protein [Streptomyces sp. NBC_01763]
MAQLEAREVPLHKVFCSDYDFRIPDYQRPYARGVVAFPLTTQVLGQDTWTPDHLEKRQTELLGLLSAGWRL